MSNSPKTKKELMEEIIEELRQAGISEDKIGKFKATAAGETPVKELSTTSLIYAAVVGLDLLALGEEVDAKYLADVVEEIDRRIPIPTEVNLN